MAAPHTSVNGQRTTTAASTEVSKSTAPSTYKQNGTSTVSPIDATYEPSDSSKNEAEKDITGTEYLKGLPLQLLVLALCLTVLLIALDISIVATALPRITDTFNSVTDIGWYAAAFTFTTATLQPLSGKIYTYFPQKHVYIAFVAVFELGSILCGTAQSSAMFIVGRAVAGMGGSGLINGALSILATVSVPSSRPMFMGLVMAVAGCGQILGPLVGGALTESVSWRWCFYINLPAGGLTLLLLFFVRFPPGSEKPQKHFVPKTIVKDFDIIGFGLFCPAIIMFMLALQWGGTHYAWNSATIIGLLVGFVVMLGPLAWWEHRQKDDAMFPSTLLRIRVFHCACITAFLAGGSLLVLGYYLPLWFQTVKLTNAFHSAIDTLPSFLSQMLFAVVAGALCPRLIPFLTPFAIIGAILSTIGAGLMTSFHPATSTRLWIGYQILSGAGRGLYMQIPVQTAQQHVPKSSLAVGTAVVSFFQFFGGSIFVAVAQTLFSNMLKKYLKLYAPDVDPSLVLGSGATDVRSLVPADQVAGLVKAYNEAIVKTLYLAVGCAALGLPFVFGLGWKRVERKVKVNKVKGEAGEK